MGRGTGAYSRLIRILKIGLPLGALALLAGLFVGRPPGPDLPSFTFAEDPDSPDAALPGAPLFLTRPVLSGRTEDGGRFRFVAERVIPDAAPPERAAIRELSGEMVLAGGLVLNLSAPEGAYDGPAALLELTGGVRLITSTGYTATAGSVAAAIAAGQVTGAGGVAAEGPLGRIDAARFTITGQPGALETIAFEGGVRLVYIPGAAQEAEHGVDGTDGGTDDEGAAGMPPAADRGAAGPGGGAGAGGGADDP